MKNNSKNQRGFSLPELLVVIAIAGIIISIVFGSVSASRSAARDLKRVSDIKQMQLALALYFDKYRTYPTHPSSSTGIDSDLAPLLTEKLLPSIPTNPVGTAYSYDQIPLTPATPKGFCLGALLEGSPQNFDGNSSCALSGSTASWYKVKNP